MRKLIPCTRCSACAVVSTAGFTSEDRYWCTDMGREVFDDDGCTMGLSGSPMRGCLHPSVDLAGHEAAGGREW